MLAKSIKAFVKKMTQTPKYSILIPTRNGAKYLPYAVRSVLSQTYEDCEVIVSVNHSSDDTLEVLKQFDDSRLKVIIPPQLLSMTKHFEWILKHARGEWVAIIGDDDGVMPYFFEELENIMARHPMLKVISNHPAHYNWDGVQAMFGNIAVNYSIAACEKVVNAKLMLLRALVSDMGFGHLPMLYANSVVHASVIHGVIQKSNGQFFHECAPDVYSGVAIAAEMKNYLVSALPLFWVGQSPKSNGLAVAFVERGHGNQDMQSRSNEFIKMSSKDGVGIAKQVDERAWNYSIASIHVYSCLHQLPFKIPLFRGRWIDYLVHAAILRGIKRNIKAKHFDQVKILQEIYQIQMQKNHLRPSWSFIAGWMHPLAKMPVRVRRFLYKRISKKRSDTKNTEIYSEDHLLYPDLQAASDHAYKIYQQLKGFE